MLDYVAVLKFCTDHDIMFEDFMLLHSLYVRNEQIAPESYEMMDDYFLRTKKTGIPWIKIVDDLEERKFLIVLKREKTPNILQIKNLKVTQKFIDLLFCRPDEIWQKFYERYPAIGVAPDGLSYFTANMLDKDDEEYFKKHIIKNANKFEASKILYHIEEMFDWNPNKGKPEQYARVGISKFLRNWKEILRKHLEEQEQQANSDWRTRRV